MRKTLFFSMLALGIVASAPHSSAQGTVDELIPDDNNNLSNVEIKPQGPAAPAAPPNTQICATNNGQGMSLLGVTYGNSTGGGLPSSGTRGLNPANPEAKSLMDQAKSLLDARQSTALANKVDVYSFADDALNDLGAIPDYVRIAVEKKPEEDQQQLNVAYAKMDAIQRDISSGKISQDEGMQLVNEAQHEIDSWKMEVDDAMSKKSGLEAADAALQRALAPLNAQLLALDQQADTMCGGKPQQ